MPTLIKSSTIDETKLPSDYYSDKREQDRPSGTGSWTISVVQNAWYAVLVFGAHSGNEPGVSGLANSTRSGRVSISADGSYNSYGFLYVGKTTGTTITLNGYTRFVRAIRIG